MTHHPVAELHEHPSKGVLYVTGGGTRLIADILTVPGASNTVLEVRVPYAETALGELLGGPVDQAASAETARALAMQAYLRARELGDDEALFGFAITASLATGRPKRGEHRAHFALQTRSHTHSWSLDLAKDLRTRAEEERLVADIGLTLIAHASELEWPGPSLTNDDALAIDSATGNDNLQALVLGERTTVGTGQPEVIFPGAFNPLHVGHHAMAEHAEARLGKPVTFEICIRNVDKPPLNYLDIDNRLAQFSEARSVWLTNTPTFVEKARALGSVTFVVGVDTIVRIAEPRYYGGAPERDAAFAELARRNCRFLVFGRLHGSEFLTLAGLDLPSDLLALCDGVAENEYRRDLSSSQIREGSKFTTTS